MLSILYVKLKIKLACISDDFSNVSRILCVNQNAPSKNKVYIIF